MTHEELLTCISDPLMHGSIAENYQRALYEVVKLHEEADGYCDICVVDYICNETYPCRTIRAIERAVNG